MTAEQWTTRSGRRLAALGAAALVALAAAGAAAQTAAEEEAWQTVRETYFAGRDIADAGGLLTLEAPERAPDAALVPITVSTQLPEGSEERISAIHLFVDSNPTPPAGTFRLHADLPSTSLSTRVRVNQYTYIHAVAEMEDGRLLATAAYVKASGGCSAPAMRDPAVALARLGRMRLNLPPVVALGEPVTAQVLISHPNNTGMQFDQVSRLYVPAHYIETIDISYNGEPVLEATTDISMSEDPSIHFTFVPEESGTLTVAARDSKGNVFTESWPVEPNSGA